MEDKVKQKIIRQLEREIKKEDGYFILHFGKKRKFPNTFKSIGGSNYVLLKELYGIIYEKSMNAYVKTYFQDVDRSVIQLVKYYDTVMEFIWGNDKHMGVYPIALKNYMEKYGQEVDLTELIPSVENLFVEGYRIKKLDNKYYLVNPSLKPEIELQKTQAAAGIDAYDYMGSLTRLLHINPSQALADREKAAVLSLELASEGEKKVFNVPFNYNNTLLRLNDLVELDDFEVHSTKLVEDHAMVVLRGQNYFGINVSFIGQDTRNYMWLLVDYAEHRMVEDLQAKHGFTFVHNLPTRYIVDHDGYMVSKIVLAPKGMLLDSINYYPTPMHQAYTWLDQLSNESSLQLRKELATFCLLQLALGNNEVDESTFQVDVDTRRILNYHHSGASYINNFKYKSVPNPMVKVRLDQSMSKMLEFREFGRMINDITRTDALPKEHTDFFAFDTDFTLDHEKNIVKYSDKITINDIPSNIFDEESGVLADIGKKMFKREVGLYDNWFAEHLKTSGVPEYSEPYLVLCNRFALFAALSAHAKGMI